MNKVNFLLLQKIHPFFWKHKSREELVLFYCAGTLLSSRYWWHNPSAKESRQNERSRFWKVAPSSGFIPWANCASVTPGWQRRAPHRSKGRLIQTSVEQNPAHQPPPTHAHPHRDKIVMVRNHSPRKKITLQTANVCAPLHSSDWFGYKQCHTTIQRHDYLK